MTEHKYHINIFWYADDQCWIADVPDLKPCSAHGATPTEAITEAEIAIELLARNGARQQYGYPRAALSPGDLRGGVTMAYRSTDLRH